MSDVVLVTGAAGRDIGRAIARAFVDRGATVAVTDKSARRLEEAAEELGAAGFVLDLREPETFAERLAEITAVVGAPTVLVNNAGVTKIVPLDELAAADWDEIFQVNLRAAWQLSALVAVGMKRAGGGAIINISSVAVYSPGWREGAYAASKAALNALTRELAAELGAFGIRCNTVAPGIVESTFIREHWAMYEPQLEKTPLGRFVTPDEVAAAVTFLASDAASGITGEVLNVTGGWYMPA